MSNYYANIFISHMVRHADPTYRDIDNERELGILSEVAQLVGICCNITIADLYWNTIDQNWELINTNWEVL